MIGLLGLISVQEGLAAEHKIVIAGRDGTYGEALQVAVDAYKEQNPDVEIELLKLPYAGLMDKVVIDLKESTGAYDLLMMDDTWVTGFGSANWLTNLTQLYQDKDMELDPDFVGAAVDAARYPYERGTAPVYGLPFVGNVELFVYREDLFEKHGLTAPPQTWDDVLNAAKTVAEQEEGVYGVVFRGTKGNPITSGFLPIFWAFGAEIIDAEGKPAVNSPEGIAALKFFLELANYAPEEVAVYNSSEVRDALLSGGGAIATEVWPAWVPDLDNPEKSKVVGKIAVTVHPGQATDPSPMIGVWHLAIPEASTRKDLALDFLQFTTSQAMQKRLALEVGLPPTRASVYTDADVVEKYRWYPTQLEALKASKVRPRLPEWLEMDVKIGTYLNLALVGDMTPEEALNELNAEIADILGQ
ncbi:extracellular solute-binding protein [candidate division KSB3 bacterium]|uniref:Extracellular solute-binding protein n=1 Tax=candidate division KSB3 bacterium TaxID=2044937 RepID=A0A9D5Q6G3_9BACT|nr:extracellular solute-binding protein [candidate division KSB3 bacterium]MBD3325814.1 extracellular solute-binding protein [candidate division KSB3 bacterium]